MYMYTTIKPRVQQINLDRRLETAHMRYAILTVKSWYSEDCTQDISFSLDINLTLLEFIDIPQTISQQIFR